jgi:hypothetical protein
MPAGSSKSVATLLLPPPALDSAPVVSAATALGLGRSYMAFKGGLQF